MRHLTTLRPLLATLLAGVGSGAVAQSVAPLTFGIPGDTVAVQRSAFTDVRQLDGALMLTVHPGFLPVVQDYAAGATTEGISVAICGLDVPPFQPNPTMAAGEIIIPLGDVDLATDALLVLLDAYTCDIFLEAHSNTAPPDFTSILPPLAASYQGLTLTSPSDTRNVSPDELLRVEAERGFNGQPIVSIEFAPAMTQWLAAETAEHLDQRIEVSVCGEVLTDPIVREPITSGSLQISGNFTKEETETLSARMTGILPCAP